MSCGVISIQTLTSVASSSLYSFLWSRLQVLIKSCFTLSYNLPLLPVAATQPKYGRKLLRRDDVGEDADSPMINSPFLYYHDENDNGHAQYAIKWQTPTMALVSYLVNLAASTFAGTILWIRWVIPLPINGADWCFLRPFTTLARCVLDDTIPATGGLYVSLK